MSGNALLDAAAILHGLGIKSKMHLADFGVGRTGHLVFPAARIVGEHGRVYGIDIDRKTLDMLEGRRRQYLVHNLQLVHGDIEQGGLDIKEHSLDKVFLVHTVGLIKRHPDLLNEIRRLLKEDGQLVVIDWRPEANHPVAPFDAFRVRPQELDQRLTNEGCVTCATFEPSPWHWGRVYEFD